MSARIAWIGAVGALGLWITLTPIPAQGASAAGTVPVVIRMGPGSTLWLEGTSTLHNFESRTPETAVTIARDPVSTKLPEGAGLAALVRGSAIRSVDVTVPVATLKSEKKGLDKNLWKTLKADEHKTITVHLEHYTLPGNAVAGDTIAVNAEGTITVAGAQRPITLAARMYPGTGGMWLEGQCALRMSDFGIKPPTMMLGTVRVGDQVTIQYRLLLVSSAAAVGSTANSGH
jgi:hypothetical protein